MNGLISEPPHTLTFLGEGQNGIVLLMDNDIDGRTVVKITYSDPFVQEAKVAKQLEVLKPRTQAFIATYGWFEHDGIIEEWKSMLPRFRQDGVPIDWEKYDSRRLTYILMEHSNNRIYYENAAAPGGVVFWQHITKQEAKKLFFILLHALYVARKELSFSHNDIHDGQIMLFVRNPNKPVMLGNGYEIRDLRFMPKFIDFGASKIGESGDMFSDDVMQLGLLFHQEELMESDEFDEASGSVRTNYKVIKRLLDSEYFSEFHGGTESVDAICMACMTKAKFKISGTQFHVCGNQCTKKIFFKV